MDSNKPPPDREPKVPDAKPRADQERRDGHRAEPDFQPRARPKPASPASDKTEPDMARRERVAPTLGGDRPRAAADVQPPDERQEPALPMIPRGEPGSPRRDSAGPRAASRAPASGPTLDRAAGDRAAGDRAAGDRAAGERTGSDPLVRVEIIDGTDSHVVLLTLNAPKIRNALTAEMRTALRGALKMLAADDTVHALIITGAEGNFCAGGDVRTMGETDANKIRARMTEVAETAEAVAAFPKPVIAAVAGHAAGAGVSLACLADIVVAEEDAQFTFSFLRLALGPDWGLSWSLPRRVGATQARGLVLARGAIDAEEAQHIGLVDHIAEDSGVDAAVALAKEMCKGPREAIAAVKTMLSDLAGLRAALDAELQMQLARFPAWEHQEGAAAFRDKRAPDYTKKR